jgi:DNA polymerase I
MLLFFLFQVNLMEIQILDVDYIMLNGKPVVRIFGKDADNKSVCMFWEDYLPYFYVAGYDAEKLADNPEILRVEKVKRKIIGRGETDIYKVTLLNPSKTPEIREIFRERGAEIFEADILFKYRFMSDFGLSGFDWIKINDGVGVATNAVRVEKTIRAKDIKPVKTEKDIELKHMAFDIECVSRHGGVPDAKNDPVIMISLVLSHPFKGKKSFVLSTRSGSGVTAFESEKEMLKRFVEIVNEYDPDVITGYNCFPGDEEIILENGEVVGIKDYIENKCGKKVVGFNSGVRPYKVHKTWEYKKGPHIVLNIKTRLGRNIRTTLDNRILTGDEEIHWTEARKLKKGDLIAVPRMINIEEEKQHFIDYVDTGRWVTDKRFIEALVRELKGFFGKKYTAKYGGKPKLQYRLWVKRASEFLGLERNAFKAYVQDNRLRIRHVKKLLKALGRDWEKEKVRIKEIDGYKLPEISEDLFYILGLIATDGSLDKERNSNRFCFYNTDKKLIKLLKEGVENITNVKTKISKMPGISERYAERFSIRVTCSILKDFFRNMGLPAGNRATRHRLTKIVKFPKGLVGAFLAGYYDGDGYKDGFLAAKDAQIKRDLQLLFTRLGIVSSINTAGTRVVKSKINQKRVDKYINPFIKTEKIKVMPKGYCFDILPKKYNNLFKKLRRENGLFLKDFSIPYSTLAYLDGKRLYFSMPQWEKIIKDFERHGLELGQLRKETLESDLFWDKIESIDVERVDEVFDLTTECSNFVVNNVLAHNCNNFDIPYILERMRKCGVRPNFGRCEQKSVVSRKVGIRYKTYISGRVIVDSYEIVKKDFSLQRYGLDFVAEKLLSQKKEDVKHSEIEKLWRGEGKDFEKLASYCLKDSVLALNLVMELNLLGKYIALSKISGTLLQDTLDSGEATRIENYLLREFNKEGYVFPSRVERGSGKKSLTGGEVLEPVKGLHSNVAVLDFRSMYPSIIKSFNICPTTLTDDAEHSLQTPSGARFLKRDIRVGIIPRVVTNLMEARQKVKRGLKRVKNKEKARLLHARQWALKIMANAFYGYFGYVRSRLFNLDIANAITSTGRKTIIDTKNAVEKRFGYRVVYGDTDSIFVEIPEEDMDKIGKISEGIVRYVNEKLPEGIQLEFEKVFKRFLPLTKKRYVAWSFVKTEDGWEEGIETKGIETVRRDWCDLVGTTMMEIIKIILKENNKKKAIDYFRAVAEKLLSNEIPIKQLVITKTMTKKPKSYAGVQPHIELVKKMQARNPAEMPGVGDRIGFVIVKGTQMLSKRAEDPVYVLEKGMQIDSKYYIENQMLPPLERIFEAMGISKSELMGNGKQIGILDAINNHRDRERAKIKVIEELPISAVNGFVCQGCSKYHPVMPLVGVCECGGELLFSSPKGPVKSVVVGG